MNLEEAVQLFIKARRGEVSESTIDWYRCRLRPLIKYFQGRDIKTITIDDLRDYRASFLDKTTRWENHPLVLPRKNGPIDKGQVY